MNKIYRGVRSDGECLITVNGEPLQARPSCGQEVFFDWGFGGTGPANTALSILSDCIGPERALPLHQQFKRAVIADLPVDGFVLTDEDVQRWVRVRAEELRSESA